MQVWINNQQSQPSLQECNCSDTYYTMEACQTCSKTPLGLCHLCWSSVANYGHLIRGLHCGNNKWCATFLDIGEEACIVQDACCSCNPPLDNLCHSLLPSPICLIFPPSRISLGNSLQPSEGPFYDQSHLHAGQQWACPKDISDLLTTTYHIHML